ncbi:MAG: hypothetical protein ACLP5V_15320 [Candidatus Bathyarchaeia archaeon]
MDEQLQARILTAVVREFLDNRRATPRRELILAFETEDVSDALCNLTNRNTLRRKDNSVPEEYLPTAASFEFCDDDQLRARAKEVVTAILHTMRRMFKTNPGEKWYTPEDLPSQVRELYPDSAFDDPNLKLGLYLIQDLHVFFGFQMNPPDNTEVVRFQIGEGIITRFKNLDMAWDIMTGYHKPVQPVQPVPSGAYDLLAAAGVFPMPLEANQVYLPAGSQHDAYVELRKIVQLAQSDMLIVDSYVDETLWELLTNMQPSAKLRVLTQQMKKDFRLEARKFSAQHGNAIEIRTTSKYHDRFIVEDSQRCWHIGASIKDAGNKAFAFSELLRPEVVKFVIADVENEWAAAAPVTL